MGDGPESLKGIGLLLQLPDTTTVTEVELEGLTEGTRIELRLAPRGGDLDSLEQATLLDAQTASGETMTLSQDIGGDGAEGADGDVDAEALENAVSGDRVLLWITELPMPDAASVGEVTGPVSSRREVGSVVPDLGRCGDLRQKPTIHPITIALPVPNIDPCTRSPARRGR